MIDITLSELPVPKPEPMLRATVENNHGSVALVFFAEGKHHASYLISAVQALALGHALTEAAMGRA